MSLPTGWVYVFPGIRLGFFACFLLYIGASDILPQVHSDKSTAFTLALTVLSVVFAFVVTRFV